MDLVMTVLELLAWVYLVVLTSFAGVLAWTLVSQYVSSRSSRKNTQYTLLHNPNATLPFSLLTNPLPPETPLPHSSQSEPIKAWRLFELGADGKLQSLITSYVWEGPSGRNPDPPRLDWWWEAGASHASGPGFFSLKDRLLVSTFSSLGVLAEVENFGTVIEHEYGYRSQGQVIRKLYVPAHLTCKQDLVRLLEQRYQCDVEIEPAPVGLLATYLKQAELDES